jgi:signal transduction histidine kinase
LAAVFQVVRRLDGEITVESQPGKGTRFVLRVPGRPDQPGQQRGRLP